MKLNRRSFFCMIPFLGMGCKVEAEKPSLSFEEELHKLIFESPHLNLYVGGECPKCRVRLDNRIIRYVFQFYADPHPNKPVRGAIQVLKSFDPYIKEWKIGDVSWCPMSKKGLQLKWRNNATGQDD